MKITGQLLAELVALVGGYLACEYITQSKTPSRAKATPALALTVPERRWPEMACSYCGEHHPGEERHE